MSIDASHIVRVFPRVISGGSPDLETNGLLLTKSNLISASTLALSFPSAASVGDYFGIDSDEYLVADVYFASYNNKKAAPTALWIARRIDADAAAWLRSVRNIKTLAQYKAITDGGFVISVDNTALTLSALDFTAATSFSDIANTIQGALVTAGATGATVTYSSLTRAFTITSGTTGLTSEVGYASSPATGTDLAAFMGLREEDGAVLSAGVVAMTPAAQMSAILTKSQNWVSFTTAWEVDPAEALEWDAWVDYGYLYVPWTIDPTAISADSVADLASQIKEANGGRFTWPIFGELNLAAFAMGVIASVPWSQLNGTITMAFKGQAGIAPLVVDEATAVILETKGYTYMGNFATRNAQFIFTYRGGLLNSDYGYVDTYINSVWFNARLQRALMDGISNSGRTPYNPRGYTMIAAWMQDPINAALFNAAIEPGVTLNERQKSEVMNEAGLDISNELYTQGYYVQVLDPGAEVRARRQSPICNIWYTYGGAILNIEVGSTAVI